MEIRRYKKSPVKRLSLIVEQPRPHTKSLSMIADPVSTDRRPHSNSFGGSTMQENGLLIGERECDQGSPILQSKLLLGQISNTRPTSAPQVEISGTVTKDVIHMIKEKAGLRPSTAGFKRASNSAQVDSRHTRHSMAYSTDDKHNWSHQAFVSLHHEKLANDHSEKRRKESTQSAMHIQVSNSSLSHPILLILEPPQASAHDNSD